MADRRIDDVKKIAVLRANGVGDFVFALPALSALKSSYPRAEITLLGRPWHAGFLSGRPGPVDRVVVVPTRSDGEDPLATWRETPGCERFLEEMTRERFDIALQMHGGGANSNPLVRRLGARVTAGSADRGALRLDRTIPYIRFHSEVLRYLEIAALVGATPVSLVPHIAVTEEDRAEAARALPPSGRPLVVLTPGARDPRRRWPATSFAAVGDALAGAGADVVVNVDDTEQALGDEVRGRMTHPAASAGPSLSLGGLVGLLERASVVVSNDTGPLHLALAVGAPSVGIYWCRNAITSAPPICDGRATCLSWRVACPVCGRDATGEDACEHAVSFVADVPAEEVIASALRLLDAGRAEPRRTIRRAQAPTDDREQIAVVRALQLGDMLCAVPALRALRKARPEARITLVGLPWHAKLRERFAGYLDDVAVLPGWPGLPEQPLRATELPGFLAGMHARHLDLALQLHGAGTQTNPLALALGARRTAGFYRPGEHCPDEGSFVAWRDEEHEVLRWRRLLEHLGIPAAGTHLEMPILPEEEAEAEAFLKEQGLSPGAYACLHPGARARAKCWPPKAFAAVADGLCAEGLPVVLTGALGEADLTQAVIDAMRAPAIDSAPADLSLGGMAALIRGARLVVCNDTGVSHIAAALRVPSAVVFTRTEPSRWAPLDRDRHRALVRPRGLEVLREARELLARFGSEPALER